MLSSRYYPPQKTGSTYKCTLPNPETQGHKAIDRILVVSICKSTFLNDYQLIFTKSQSVHVFLYGN